MLDIATLRRVTRALNVVQREMGQPTIPDIPDDPEPLPEPAVEELVLVIKVKRAPAGGRLTLHIDLDGADARVTAVGAESCAVNTNA